VAREATTLTLRLQEHDPLLLSGSVCGETAGQGSRLSVTAANNGVEVEVAAARSMLRQVIALADEAPALTDDQLRARLVDLARTARPGVPPWLMTPRFASDAPAGHWLRDAPESAPGGQPVPDPPDQIGHKTLGLRRVLC
jgi:hypothetical protein